LGSLEFIAHSPDAQDSRLVDGVTFQSRQSLDSATTAPKQAQGKKNLGGASSAVSPPRLLPSVS